MRLPRAARVVSALLAVCVVGSWTSCCSSAEGVVIHHHHHSKLYNSEYFSLHKTRPLPHMNLSPRDAVDSIIETRAFRNEIIVTCFTSHMLRWMLHYARMAQSLGFDHFVVVGQDEETCDLFRAAWCRGVCRAGSDPEAPGGCMATYPGCGWIGDGLSEERDHARHMFVERLWLFRYHLAAELVRKGINVLMSDLDVVIHGDFYALAKSRPLDRFHFLQMPGDSYPNGGLWYVQNAHPRGQVARWLEAAVKLSLTILKLRKVAPDMPMGSLAAQCSWVDQDVLKYVLASMTHNRSWEQWACLVEDFPDTASEWRAAFGDGPGAPPHPIGWVGLTEGRDLLPPWDHLVAQRDKVQNMGDMELMGLEFMHPPYPRNTCLGQAECARLGNFVRQWGRQLISMEVAVVFPPGFGPDEYPLPAEVGSLLPAVPDHEQVLSAPLYLLNDARVMWSGWATPRPMPWGMVTHLVAFGKSWGRVTGGRGNRMHLVQSQGLWHAPEPMPERLVRISQPLARAAAARPTDAEFRKLVHALMVVAAVTGRTPVLPATPCGEAPWMERSDETLHGFDDPHFVAYLQDLKEASEGDNVMCAPYLSRSDECTDEVVLSEFHLEQDLLYSSYSHATVTVSSGDDGAAAAEANGSGAAALVLALDAVRAAEKQHVSARVLFVGGDVEAVTGLSAVRAPGGGGGLGGVPLLHDEEQRLAELGRACPDFVHDESQLGLPVTQSGRRKLN